MACALGLHMHVLKRREMQHLDLDLHRRRIRMDLAILMHWLAVVVVSDIDSARLSARDQIQLTTVASQDSRIGIHNQRNGEREFQRAVVGVICG
jgi:hypothetical protein